MAKTSKKAVAKTKKAKSPCNARGYKRAKENSPKKLTEDASKRGETIDFKDLTHTWKLFEGIKISGGNESSGEDDLITVRLLKNARGEKMKEPVIVKVKGSEVRELTVYDMIGSIDIAGDEAEDKALIDFEQKSWECSKCKKLNGNDAGYCIKMSEDGKQCGGTKKCEEKLSWAGCFSSTKVCFYHSFLFHQSQPKA